MTGVSHITPRHRAFSRAGLTVTGHPPARRHRGARSAQGCPAAGSPYGRPIPPLLTCDEPRGGLGGVRRRRGGTGGCLCPIGAVSDAAQPEAAVSLIVAGSLRSGSPGSPCSVVRLKGDDVQDVRVLR